VLFNSAPFLFGFLPVVLTGFVALSYFGQQRMAGVWLTCASLFFYAWWNPIYLPLLMGSMIFNYVLGGYLVRKPSILVLAFGIAANLFLLGYYKYTGFLVHAAGQLAGLDWAIPNIVLPLAISFFTFQQIAYLVDCHDGDVVEHDFLNYCLFITFFPHLIAGPITHHREMFPQFNAPAIFRPKLDSGAHSVPDWAGQEGRHCGHYGNVCAPGLRGGGRRPAGLLPGGMERSAVIHISGLF
jgi:D-alanyl-lipoteichoic acid acyltransferase DltB (MBOAT superfamily)